MDPDRTDSQLHSGPYGSSADPVTVHPVTTSPDESKYKMDHEHRGIAIVTNHTTFDHELALSSRVGSANHRDAIYLALKILHFKVLVFNDLTKDKLFNQLEKVAKWTHVNKDCLVVVVLTHGGNGTLYARDGDYETERLWKPFVGDACPTLIGKPKLFFIQTCRSNPRTNAAAASDAADSRQSSSTHQYTIPTMADLLVGYYTYVEECSTPWYMLSLTKNLIRHANNMDLLNLLALVAKDVAKENAREKQIPFCMSTLTKALYFPDPE